MKCFKCGSSATFVSVTIGILDNTITKPMRKCIDCGASWEEVNE